MVMDNIDIERLIPQRHPIRMVDRLISYDNGCAVTELTIRPDNFFVEEDGLLLEAGLIENIAQSASAMAGYEAIKAGAAQPPVGYIGEVKNFRLLRRPAPGEKLTTTINKGPEVEGVTIVVGRTESNGETLAETQMKIFINKD